jgi:hypothetical protein
MVFLLALLPPVLSYEPPYDPEAPPTEFAVKIEGDWHHTTHEWDYCDDLYDDGWFTPYVIPAPGLCTEFTVEVWAIDAYDLYAYEFWLAWDWCWLELTSWTVIDLGEGGLTAHSDIVDADDSTAAVEPMYVQIWTFLNPVEDGVNGTVKLAELTFHVIQDPSWDDVFYSIFYLVFAQASTSCGEEVTPSREHAVCKLHSLEPVVLKELSSNVTSVVGDTITVDINVYNATKLKSFEFVLNYPDWLKLDLQNDPITIGDFLPPPYEEMIIVVGPSDNFPWVCPTQVWIKIIMDCNKPGVSGDGTLASFDFEVLNPFLPGKLGPDYTYCEDDCKLWIPENITDEICFKDEGIWLDGVACWQDKTHYDPAQQNWFAGLAPPFGPPCEEVFWDMWVDVDNATIMFLPIPADGNLDGHVGLLDMVMGTPLYGIIKWMGNYYDRTDPPPGGAILDIAALAADMGISVAEWEMLFELTDIVEDDIIDLFDLVQMAKNWCRTEPVIC